MNPASWVWSPLCDPAPTPKILISRLHYRVKDLRVFPRGAQDFLEVVPVFSGPVDDAPVLSGQLIAERGLECLVAAPTLLLCFAHFFIILFGGTNGSGIGERSGSGVFRSCVEPSFISLKNAFDCVTLLAI